MKPSFFQILLCASLAVFAVGCGKDNKSSGGGGVASNNLNFDPNHLNQSSQQVIQELNNWYNGNTEGPKGTGIVDIQKIQSSQNSNQTCDSLDWKFISIPYCYSSSSSSSNGTVISELKKVNLVRDNVKISSRNNAELNSVFNGSVGEIVQATKSGSNVIRISVLKNNVVTTYTINKNYHSLLNPIEKTVTTAQGYPSTVYTYAVCSFSVGCTF